MKNLSVTHRNPALFYSLFLFIGIAASLRFSWSYFLPLILLLKRPLHNSGYPKKIDHFDSISNLREPAYTGRLIGGDRKSKDCKMNIFSGCPELCRGLLKGVDKRQLCKALFVTLFGFFYTQILYTFPKIEKISGEGVFHIHSLSIRASPFTKAYLYQGYFKIFETEQNHTWKDIPCSFYIPLHKLRVEASSDLLMKGDLICKSDKKYVFKPSLITPLQKGFSLAEIRFQFKQTFFSFLSRCIPDKEAASFLNSMLTGDVEERVLNLEFNKLGLQHILGVSGFQFVLLAALIGFLLHSFLPYKIALGTLLFLLSSYFFFLGNSPPVQRAWISISVILIGKMIERKTSSLNALGVALGAALLFDPLVILHIGFQLSFLSTFAILTLYPHMRLWMKKWLPTRSFKEVLLLSPLNLTAYIFLSFIKETLALNLAVHFFALPTLLCLFGKFPLLSVFYNLFFPLGATIVFVGSLIALFFTLLIPPLGMELHHYNTLLTSLLLKMSNSPPAALEFFIRAPYLPLEWVVVIFMGVWVWLEFKQKRENVR